MGNMETLIVSDSETSKADMVANWALIELIRHLPQDKKRAGMVSCLRFQVYETLSNVV